MSLPTESSSSVSPTPPLQVVVQRKKNDQDDDRFVLSSSNDDESRRLDTTIIAEDGIDAPIITATVTMTTNSAMMATTTTTTLMSTANMAKARPACCCWLRFRTARPTDVTHCAALERISYPAEDAARKTDLQYRQHHAAPYFRVAVLVVKQQFQQQNQVVVLGNDEKKDKTSPALFVACKEVSLLEEEVVRPPGPLGSMSGDEKFKHAPASPEDERSLTQLADDLDNCNPRQAQLPDDDSADSKDAQDPHPPLPLGCCCSPPEEEKEEMCIIMDNDDEYEEDDDDYYELQHLRDDETDDVDDEHEEDTWQVDKRIVGFVCGTRCSPHDFDGITATTTHDPAGRYLVIHSVVVDPAHRRRKFATHMMHNYIRAMEKRELEQQQSQQAEHDFVATAVPLPLESQDHPVPTGSTATSMTSSISSTMLLDRIVLVSKRDLLTFFLHCGFSIVRPRPPVASQVAASANADAFFYECARDMNVVVNRPSVQSFMASTNVTTDSTDLTQVVATGGCSTDADQHGARTTVAGVAGRPCFVVDAFCDLANVGQPRSGTTSSSSTCLGNPAAVVLLPQAPPLGTSDHVGATAGSAWMLRVAAEFNLSEAAFVWPWPSSSTSTAREGAPSQDDNDGKKHQLELHYGIRYFTPTIEVALCGHATLAAAAVLYQQQQSRQPGPDNRNSSRQCSMVFHATRDVMMVQPTEQQLTRATPTTIDDRSRHLATDLTMTFPAKPPRPLTMTEQEPGSDDDEGSLSSTISIRNVLQQALGIPPKDVLYVGVNDEIGDILVQVTPEALQQIPVDAKQLNIPALLQFPLCRRGWIISSIAAKKEHAPSKTLPPTAFSATNIVLAAPQSAFVPVGQASKRAILSTPSDKSSQHYTQQVKASFSHINSMIENKEDEENNGHDDDDYDDYDRPTGSDLPPSQLSTHPTPPAKSSSPPGRRDVSGGDDDDDNYDHVWSRFFGPRAGIDEDPVTGSAHCLLVPYYALMLQRTNLTCRQLSHRGGLLHCRLLSSLPHSSSSLSSSSCKRIGHNSCEVASRLCCRATAPVEESADEYSDHDRHPRVNYADDSYGDRAGQDPTAATRFPSDDQWVEITGSALVTVSGTLWI